MTYIDGGDDRCGRSGVWLISWCFKSGQPQRITSSLKETFIKRYIVEKTSKAEIRLEEQREKTESCRENLRNENTVERAIKTETDTRTE